MTHKPIYYATEQKVHAGVYPDAAKPGMVIGPYRKDDNIWYETRDDGTEHPLFPATFAFTGTVGQVLTHDGNDVVWTTPPIPTFSAADTVINDVTTDTAPEGTIAVVSGVLGLNDGNVYESNGAGWDVYHVAAVGDIINIPGAGNAQWDGTKWEPTADAPTGITPSNANPGFSVLVSDHTGPAEWVAGEPNQVLAINNAGDGIGFVDNPLLSGGGPNQVLTMNASGTAPVWTDPAPGTVDTNNFIPPATFENQLFYSTAAGDVNSTGSGGGGNGAWLSPGAAGQVLTINATGAIAWETPSNPLGNLPTPVLPANANQIIVVNETTGEPEWADAPAGYDLPDATGLSIPFASGAGDPQDVQQYLAPGTADQVLAVNATGDGFVWQSVSALASSYDLPDATAAGQIAYFNAAGDPSTTQSYLAIGTQDQVLTVSAAGLPVWADSSLPTLPAGHSFLGSDSGELASAANVYRVVDSVVMTAQLPYIKANLKDGDAVMVLGNTNGVPGVIHRYNEAAGTLDPIYEPSVGDIVFNSKQESYLRYEDSGGTNKWVAKNPVPTSTSADNDMVLTVVNGAATWAPAPAGYDLPDATGLSIPFETGAGDPSGVQSYLDAGAPNQVLTVNNAGDGFVWQSMAALTTSYDLADATAQGQIVVMNAAGDPSSSQGYLDIGTPGQMLTVNGAGNMPEWTDNPLAGLTPASSPADDGKVLTFTGGNLSWEPAAEGYNLPDSSVPGQIAYFNGAGDPQTTQKYLNIGTPGQILTVDFTATVPEWVDNPLAGLTAPVSPANDDTVLTFTGGNLSWAPAPATYDLPDATAANQLPVMSGAGDPKDIQTYLDIGQPGQVLAVNATGDGYEWINYEAFDMISLCEFTTSETVIAREGEAYFVVPAEWHGRRLERVYARTSEAIGAGEEITFAAIMSADGGAGASYWRTNDITISQFNANIEHDVDHSTFGARELVKGQRLKLHVTNATGGLKGLSVTFKIAV